MTDSVVVEEEQVQQLAIRALLDLEAAGGADEVSLTLTDTDMPYQRWEDIGRFLGSVDRRARWYVGDWMNFGEAIYGQEASQGVDSTTKQRYSEAERVTGLDHGTLLNIRSVCGKVPRKNRRKELGFWIHAEVAKLDIEEQPRWLELAVTEGLTKSELRDAIRAEKNPQDEDESPVAAPASAGEGTVSIGERIEEAARLVWTQAQNDSAGDFVVPASAMRQLASALGEE